MTAAEPPRPTQTGPSADASDGRVRVAVDVGGTFTDVVLLAPLRQYTAKVLTTPTSPERGVIEGVEDILAQAGLAWRDIDLLILGTTLATNALIERKGAPTVLVTTQGFRDLVEIGQEDRFAQYDVFLDKPAPLVPRHWRYGVTERLDAAGRVITPLDEGQLHRLATAFSDEGIESVAICFLHAYANPAHERRARDLLKQSAPGLWITLSSDVCPEIREYERLSTTCANAYVQPLVAGYLDRLNRRATELGLRSEPFLMTSGGAITTLETGMSEPVRLVESGPAGGAVLSCRVAEQIGAKRALSFDMGGTTAKICFIDDYQPQISRSFEFGRVHRHLKGSGLPIRIPVIEMVEIGAGGGSIARINHLGVVQVGPDSAGSLPGPAAYGLGGESPTVTDANIVLGTIDPKRFAAGKVPIDEDLARKALATGLTSDIDAGAQAVVEMVTETMANAARVHASELGKSAEDYTLIAFGGAAPLHAAHLARKLGITRLVIPKSAGVGSALGFLWAPVAYQIVRSLHQRLDYIDHARIERLLADLASAAESVVRRAAPGAILAQHRLVYMRYAGQGHEIAIDLPTHPFDVATTEQLKRDFETRYTELYGRCLSHIPLEAVSWSILVQAGERQRPESDSLSSAGVNISSQSRRLFLAETSEWRSVPVFDRDQLKAGAVVDGPALVVENETTTYVASEFRARVSRLGALILDDVRLAEAAQ